MRFFFFAFVEIGQPDAANRHVVEICNGLTGQGHHVWLFVPGPVSTPSLLRPDVQLVTIPSMRSARQIHRTVSYYALLFWYALWRFLAVRPDVVYSRFSFLDILALAPLRVMFSFHYVAEVNGIRSLETTRSAIQRHLVAGMEKRSLKLCDQAICVTPEIRDWALACGQLEPTQVTVIGNGVDVDRFHPMPEMNAKTQLGLDPLKRYLTFVGSFKPWHDLSLLVRVLPAILDRFPEQVQLLLVGDGPGRKGLEQLAQQTGVSHVVISKGSVPSQLVPVFISAAEVCLSPFPSRRNRRYGVSSLKVFEYMACGRPFVTTRLGIAFDGWLEAHDCGVLVNPDDEEAFADAIIDLLCEPDTAHALGQRGRQVAVRCCSWATVVEQTEQFILSHPRWKRAHP